MKAVASSGYRAIAADMRGYGRSSAPTDADQYTPFHTVGDLIGLLDALGLQTVTVVGHDFGANIAWNTAMMRPDRFTAVFGISVPFPPRYDKASSRSYERLVMRILYVPSNQAAAWADSEDVAYAVGKFTLTGFRGGFELLSSYRVWLSLSSGIPGVRSSIRRLLLPLEPRVP